eukprot:scaffold3.g6750.t1
MSQRCLIAPSRPARCQNCIRTAATASPVASTARAGAGAGDTVRVAVLGASGYTGEEVVRLLALHPTFKITVLTGDRQAGKEFAEVFPHLVAATDVPSLCKIDDVKWEGVDAVFCCLPHGTTQEVVSGLPEHVRVVDLSADFRLRNVDTYAEWYGDEHRAPELQKAAVYGLTELHRDAIAGARLVANPGCYPTSLPLVPLLERGLIQSEDIIIDAKSGISGAGRSAKQNLLYSEATEGINAYGVTRHRHMPEIEQGLADAVGKPVTVSFTPHLMPMTRGMESACYVRLAGGASVADLRQALQERYAGEPFVHVLAPGVVPQTHHVRGSNYCLVNVFEDRIPDRAIVIAAVLLDERLQLEQQEMPEALQSSWQALRAGLAAAAAGGQHRLQRLFYQRAFQQLADVLLTIVAPDWLPRLSSQQRRCLFDRWFDRAPAPALLPALAPHLDAVRPAGAARGGASRLLVTAVSADVAADLLAARFVAPASSGLRELLAHVRDAAAAQARASSREAGAGAAAEPTSQAAGGYPQSTDSLAALLASLPDRAAALEAPALQPTAAVPTVVTQLISLLSEAAPAEQGCAGVGSASEGGGATNSMAAAAFVADVLGRLCRRGHAALAAAALWELLTAPGSGAGGGSPAPRAEGGAAGAAATAVPSAAAAEAVISKVVALLDDSVALERLIEAFLRQAAAAASDAAAVQALSALLPPATWAARSDARLLLSQRLLTAPARLLSAAALRCVLLYLRGTGRTGADAGAAAAGAAAAETVVAGGAAAGAAAHAAADAGAPGDASALAGAAAHAAQLWADKPSIQRLPLRQQAYLSTGLAGALSLLRRWELDAQPGLLSALLLGAVRLQGMRVGKALSQLLEPGKPALFEEDRPDELLPEERWEQAAAPLPPLPQPPQARPTERAGSDPSKGNLQLRDLSRMLLSQAEKDWRGQLRALRALEPLVRAAPDELEHYAGEGGQRRACSCAASSSTEGADTQHPAPLCPCAPLSVPLTRAVLHSLLPKWADEEVPAGLPPAEMQRFRGLVSLLAGAPEAAGLALAGELYSPSLDQRQRCLVLDCMASAAAELAHPGSVLKALPAPAGGGGRGGGVRAGAAPAEAPPPEPPLLPSTTADGRRRLGRVTRVAPRSLAVRQQAAAAAAAAQRANRFPPVALKWAAALLKECDRRHHGIDMFGRDAFLLGKLLTTLGAFLEASAHSPQAAALAAATVEFLRAERVHAHPEPFVMAAVPPAQLASAMLPGVGGGDARDAALLSRLEWLRDWTGQVSASDSDATCRSMAAACQRLQASLAAGAMAALEGSAGGAAGGGGLLPPPGRPAGVSVAVPALQGLRLG